MSEGQFNLVTNMKDKFNRYVTPTKQNPEFIQWMGDYLNYDAVLQKGINPQYYRDSGFKYYIKYLSDRHYRKKFYHIMEEISKYGNIQNTKAIETSMWYINKCASFFDISIPLNTNNPFTDVDMQTQYENSSEKLIQKAMLKALKHAYRYFQQKLTATQA